MDPSLKLFFDELNRKFDELEARWERRFSPPMKEQVVAAEELRVGDLKPLGATQGVVADNWGGWFKEPAAVELCDGAPKRIPAAHLRAEVVPDNWGGLFEQTPHATEERSLDLSAANDIIGSAFLLPDKPEIPSIVLASPPTLVVEEQHNDGSEDSDGGKAAVFPEDVPTSICHRDSSENKYIDAVDELPRLTTKKGRTFDQREKFERDGRRPLRSPTLRRPRHPRLLLCRLRRPWGSPPFRPPRRASPRRRGRPPRLLARVRGHRPRLGAGVRVPLRRVLLQQACASPFSIDFAMFPHVFRLDLDNRVGGAPTSAAALRIYAMGAAGGGLLAWMVAAGTTQATCSIICLAGARGFAAVSMAFSLFLDIVHQFANDDRDRAARDRLELACAVGPSVEAVAGREDAGLVRVCFKTAACLLSHNDRISELTCHLGLDYLVSPMLWRRGTCRALEVRMECMHTAGPKYAYDNSSSVAAAGSAEPGLFLCVHLVRGRALKTMLPGVHLLPEVGKLDSSDLLCYWTMMAALLLLLATGAMERDAFKVVMDLTLEGPSFLRVLLCNSYLTNVTPTKCLMQGANPFTADPVCEAASVTACSAVAGAQVRPGRACLRRQCLATGAPLQLELGYADSVLVDLPVVVAHFNATLLLVDTPPMPNGRKAHASPGTRQVFEVLILQANIFCNIFAGLELISCGECIAQQPWPPPDVHVEFECVSIAVRPLPWPSFPLSSCCFMSQVAYWKPPWPLQPRQGMVNTVAMQAEDYEVHLKARECVLQQDENIPERVNLTVQSWATSQTLGYISLASIVGVLESMDGGSGVPPSRLSTCIGVLVSSGGVSVMPPSSQKSSCLGFLTLILGMPTESSLQKRVKTCKSWLNCLHPSMLVPTIVCAEVMQLAIKTRQNKQLQQRIMIFASSLVLAATTKLEALVSAACGASSSEFGVDPNVNPELALALQISVEDKRARQEAVAKPAREESSQIESEGFQVVMMGNFQAAGTSREACTIAATRQARPGHARLLRPRVLRLEGKPQFK